MLKAAMDKALSVLPAPLAARLEPIGLKIHAAATGQDDAAHSQRLAFTVFLIRVASAGIAFVSQVLLARWLGLFDYGVFVAVWTAFTIVALMTAVGFPSGVVRFIAEYRQEGKNDHVRGIIHAALGISFVLSCIAALAIAGLSEFFSAHIADYYRAPILVACLSLPFLTLSGVLDGVGRAFDWPKTAFIPSYVLRPLGILLFSGLAILAGFKLGATLTMAMAALAALTSSLLHLAITSAKAKRVVPHVPARYRVKTWILVTLPIFLVEVFFSIFHSVDILSISYLMRPEDTAIYFAAAKILALVHFVHFAVKAAVGHRFASCYKRGNRAELRDLVANTVTWTFWPTLMLAVFMALTGRYLLMLFGAEFAAGEPILWILLGGLVARASIGPCEALLIMTGHERICAATLGVTLLMAIALNLVLIPYYGLAGAAWATLFAYVFESFALHAMVRRTLCVHAFLIPSPGTKPSFSGTA